MFWPKELQVLWFHIPHIIIEYMEPQMDLKMILVIALGTFQEINEHKALAAGFWDI